MTMNIAYLAAPYTHNDSKVQQMRYDLVTRVAYNLIKEGILVYSPLTHNVPIDKLGLHGDWLRWKEFDHGMLSRCDRLLVLKLPGWEISKGVAAEIAHAKEIGLPIEWLEWDEENDVSSYPTLEETKFQSSFSTS